MRGVVARFRHVGGRFQAGDAWLGSVFVREKWRVMGGGVLAVVVVG